MAKKQLPLPTSAHIADTSLADEAEQRYLTYALSVITSRALPDVRDGLKPVQRRILYAMHQGLHLHYDVKPRKCALIVGDVMGKYHPHGDTAIYDALVRMAQDFVMCAPLVDGRGNFGSQDGDSAAAMRYTEARLAKLSDELLSEIKQQTVAFRPNYDATRFEPVVLPARFPNLLVNGSQGIAVGMATSIPPHNLGEVIDGCIALIDDPNTTLKQLVKIIKGPDFPTGGQLMSSRKELEEVYASGQGSLKLRGEWKLGEESKSKGQIIITSIPYSALRSSIVTQIAEVIIQRKLPILLDVRDESTEECRVVLEFKKGADPQLVMAYLYKHTGLQTNVQVNLTCLVPTENPDVPAPRRLDLRSMLQHFLEFRMQVVTKRLNFDLAELERQIHVLRGFEKIFDALDETIKIIRKSEGKKDAAEKLMKRFELDEDQVEAILELKLYRLARLEILIIRKELDEKEAQAKKLSALLKSTASRWKLIRGEFEEIKGMFKGARRTRIQQADNEPEFRADDFIVDEDAVVILTQQGWVKRQREVKDISTTRLREGDKVIGVAALSTKATLAFFSSQGVCYVCRGVDIPATTGHGSPVQTMFKLADGERIIKMMSFDPRMLPAELPSVAEGEPQPPWALALTRQGQTMRFSLSGHVEPSTKAGRRYMRPREGDEVMLVELSLGGELLGMVTEQGNALLCKAHDVPILAGAGKGVMGIKVAEGDKVFAAILMRGKQDQLQVKHESGKRYDVAFGKIDVGARGSRGQRLFKKGVLNEVLESPIEIPVLQTTADQGSA